MLRRVFYLVTRLINQTPANSGVITSFLCRKMHFYGYIKVGFLSFIRLSKQVTCVKHILWRLDISVANYFLLSAFIAKFSILFNTNGTKKKSFLRNITRLMLLHKSLDHHQHKPNFCKSSMKLCMYIHKHTC